MGKGSAPSAPPMSAEERALLVKNSKLLDLQTRYYEDALSGSKEQSDILKRISGLYDVDAGGSLVLNQAALKRQQELAKVQMDRYEKALRGELPISESTQERKRQEFDTLKENAARRGINIQGDTLETATSDSTAGAALLGRFKTSYGLLEDAERRGELAGGVNSGLSLMGASQAAGPISALGAGGGLMAGYNAVSQPYANQRMLEYQAGLNKSAYKNQGLSALYGLGGMGIGALLALPTGGMSVPIGAALGGTAGGYAGNSLTMGA